MKTFRYRKDLKEHHFKVRHDFRKGFRKLGIMPLYSGEVFNGLVMPLWERYAPGMYRLAGTEHRKVHITVVSNADVKRICKYIYTEKDTVLRTFFDFAALPVLSAEHVSSKLMLNARFEYENRSSYAFVTNRLIKQ